MKRVILFFISTFVYLYSVGVFSKHFIADIYYVSSLEELSHYNFEKAKKHAFLAKENNSQEPSYYRGSAKILLASQIIYEEEDSTNDLKETALTDLRKSEDLNPKNLATLRNSIPLYYYLGVESLEKNSIESEIDQYYIKEIEKYYSALKKMYPNDLGVITDIAKYEKRLGLEKEYSESYEIAKNLRPDIVEWHEVFMD